MSGESETGRMRILQMIENGQLSAEEGVRLLQALGPEEPAPAENPLDPAAETEIDEMQDKGSAITGGVQMETLSEMELEHTGTVAAIPEIKTPPYEVIDEEIDDVPFIHHAADDPPPSGLPKDVEKWKRWWTIPLWIGVAITISGAFLMYTAIQGSGYGLGFVCAWVPLIIGVLVLALAWQSRTSPWLHLRVKQAPGERPQRIAFSFPIPIRPTVWLLRVFGNRIKEVEGISLDEMLLAVGESTSPDNPIYIKVDEGENEEKVEIFIG